MTLRYLRDYRGRHCRRLMAVLVLLLFFHPLQAQIMPVGVPAQNSLISESDSAETLPINDSVIMADSSMSDSARIKLKEEKLGIKISEDALDYKIISSSRDSMVLEVPKGIYKMYGDVDIQYNDIELKSGDVSYLQKDNTLTATPTRDTNNRIISIQEFKQGAERFTYDSLKYNFVSKRAIVRNAKSQYGEGFINSQQVKRNADGSVYGWKNGYTTCDLDTPHFAIRARRIKMVPNRIVATGPANLEIQHVPTPLFLPFGIFPINDKQRSGFILPSYTIEEQRGLGLQRGGYYFALNDYLGVTTQFDIFSKGSWGFLGRADYAKRYHYSGNLQIGYNYTKIGEVYEPSGSVSKDFNITLSHQQDAKARPGTTFGASVNIITRNYNKLNGVDALQMLNNTFSSSISYSKNWIGKPYSFSAALRHSQNTQTGEVNVTLPDINFSISQITPFQRKNATGVPRWYERISGSYNIRAVNEWAFYDSTFNINNIALSDFNNGIVQNLNIGAAYNIFRFFNLSFSVPYTEYWNTKQVFRNYDSATNQTDTVINKGFFATRSFSANASVSTRLYGLMMFKKGKIMGVRHVLTPNIGFSYQPGFAFPPFEYFYRTQIDPSYPYTYESPYVGPYSPIGGPGNPEPSGAITFGLNNNLQMKVRSGDSVGNKNISLLDAFSINSSYNLFADSLNLAPFNMRAQTSILKIFNVSGSAVFDPYKWDKNIRTNQLLIRAGEGLADFRRANLAVGFNYSAEKKNVSQQNDSMNNNDQVNRLLGNGGYDDYYDFNIPWNISANYSLNASKSYYSSRDKDSIAVTHSLMFSGSLSLTNRWQINLQSGYNFTNKEIGLTSINISRDLHCWQMSLNLIPFGDYRSFNFLLQVKSSVLQDLKLIRRKTYLDNY